MTSTDDKYIEYRMLRNCGCCYEILFFKNDESANAAVEAAGLTVDATIVDDKGEASEDIDTFYGIERSNIEDKRNPIQALADKLFNKE